MDVDQTGWIYILVNPCMPALAKIGWTSKLPSERAAQLSKGTGIPVPFEVAASYSTGTVEKSIALEKAIHDQLAVHRSNQGREFFHLSPDAAKKLVEQILNQWGVDVAPQAFDRWSTYDTRGLTLEDLWPTGDRKLGVEHGREWPKSAEKGQCEAVVNLNLAHPHFHYLMTLYADSELRLPDNSEYIIGFYKGVCEYAWEIERRMLDREYESTEK